MTEPDLYASVSAQEWPAILLQVATDLTETACRLSSNGTVEMTSADPFGGSYSNLYEYSADHADSRTRARLVQSQSTFVGFTRIVISDRARYLHAEVRYNPKGIGLETRTQLSDTGEARIDGATECLPNPPDFSDNVETGLLQLDFETLLAKVADSIGPMEWAILMVDKHRNTLHRDGAKMESSNPAQVGEIAAQAQSIEQRLGSELLAVGWFVPNTSVGTCELRVQDSGTKQYLSATRPARLNGWLIRWWFGAWVWDGPWEQVAWSEWRVTT
jgi:hypothetical protein